MGETNIDVRDDAGATDDCRALADILVRVGDKWTVMVVGVLSQGTRRYSEIARTIDGISQRMLTLTLKGLERDGLVTRTLYPTIPPRVDYDLTDRGRTLIAPLTALREWAAENRAAIGLSRRSFDARSDDAP